MTHKKLILIIAVILGVAIGATAIKPYLLSGTGGTNLYTQKIAEIYQDGKLIKTLNLSELSTPLTFDILYDNNGKNTVTADKDCISVSHSDCPDKVCVKSGKLTDKNGSIVCLPHKLVIKIVEKADDTIPENSMDTVDIISR